MSAKCHTREGGAPWAPLRWVIFLLLAMLPSIAVGATPAQTVRVVLASFANHVAVTTTADVADGDTSSFANLNSQPGPDGAISLREALLSANTTPTATLALTITFSIPITDTGYDATLGAWTISVGGENSSAPDSALPPLARGNLRIDGTTQPGSSSHPRIVLDGYDVYEADGFNNGLTITSDGNKVRGLALADFYDASIALSGATAANNQVAGCYMGTDALGLNPQTYGPVGVEVRDGAHDNVIGGASVDRNLISGMYNDGVWIHDATTTRNTVAGNWIGVDATGQAALPNWAGVHIEKGAHHNIVGSAGQGNVLSGNDLGVYIVGGVGNTVAGNIVGLAADGTTVIGNRGGIFIVDGAHDNLIGGATPGARNIISGNSSSAYGQGVYLYGANTTNNTIQGNYIGVDASGIRPAGNSTNGVLIASGAQGNTIGGTASGAGNVIAYNGYSGIWLDSGANLVGSNLIGVGADGTTALPNQQNGVRVQGDNNIIGPGNLIAYNHLSGIKLSGTNTTIISNTLQGNDRSGICVAGAATRILTNTIIDNGGFDDAGVECNIQGGVVITGTARTEIISNTIQSNIGAGITVRAGPENRILSNSISNNSTVGIQLLEGGNEDIAPPTIVSASTITVTGTSCPNCLVEIFADDDDEGRNFITATTALTNGVFIVTLPPGVIDLPHVTATNTDSNGNTSPFAVPVAVGPTPPPPHKFIYLPLIRR
jgi:parallel beta-helix repeat protein